MKTFFAITLSVILSLALFNFMMKNNQQNTGSLDKVMERINKTQTIRCGYVSYSPASIKNQLTGKVEGYNVDLVEEAAHRMGLKVEWTYETNWPTLSADLNAQKFDVACVNYWNNPRAARQMLSSLPVFYQPVFFASKASDNRFDNDISKINNPDVKVSVLEGDVPETILKELYPLAIQKALPQSASFPQVFHEVASGKADVTITAKPDMYDFQQNNPNVLKIITNQPVRLYPSGIQFPSQAHQVKNAFDVTIREMQLDGTVERILKKYAKSPDDYYFIQNPYKKID